MGLYDEPEVYDLLSAWPLHEQTEAVSALVTGFLGRRPTSLLDPSCGSGRVLEAFASRGLRTVGIDCSPAMLAFATRRLQDFPKALVLPGDMRNFDLGESFDVAFQPVNSFRLLTSAADVASHLRSVRRHVPKGVYVLELWVQSNRGDVPFHRQVWSARRGPMRAKVAYVIETVDDARRRSEERTTVHFTVNGQPGEVDELTPMRLWRSDELSHFIAEEGSFRIAGWFDQGFVAVPDALLGSEPLQYYVLLVPTENESGSAGRQPSRGDDLRCR